MLRKGLKYPHRRLNVVLSINPITSERAGFTMQLTEDCKIKTISISEGGGASSDMCKPNAFGGRDTQFRDRVAAYCQKFKGKFAIPEASKVKPSTSESGDAGRAK